MTIAAEQKGFIDARIAERGLGDRVEIRLQDYREGPGARTLRRGRPRSRWASTSARATTRRTSRCCAARCEPGGRVLVQQMSRAGTVRPGGGPFIESLHRPRHAHAAGRRDRGAARAGGLEVRDVHALREHYVRTVGGWLERFEAQRDRLTELVRRGGRARLAALPRRRRDGLPRRPDGGRPDPDGPPGWRRTRCRPVRLLAWTSTASSSRWPRPLAVVAARDGDRRASPAGSARRGRRRHLGPRASSPSRWSRPWSAGADDADWHRWLLLVLVARVGRPAGLAHAQPARRPGHGRTRATPRCSAARCAEVGGPRPCARSSWCRAWRSWFVSAARGRRRRAGARARLGAGAGCRGVGASGWSSRRSATASWRRTGAAPRRGTGDGPRAVGLDPAPELLRRRLRVVGALAGRRGVPAGSPACSTVLCPVAMTSSCSSSPAPGCWRDDEQRARVGRVRRAHLDVLPAPAPPLSPLPGALSASG